jgi:hypothetical protein
MAAPAGPFLAAEPTGPLIMLEVMFAPPDAGGGAIPVCLLPELELGPRVCAVDTRHSPMRVLIPELEAEVDARASADPADRAAVRETIAKLRWKLEGMRRAGEEAAAAPQPLGRGRAGRVDVATVWVHLAGRARAGQLRQLKFFHRVANYIQVLGVRDIELSDAEEAVGAFIAAVARSWPRLPPLHVERRCVSLYNCNFVLTPPPGRGVSLSAAEAALRASPQDGPTRVTVKPSASDVALRARAWTAARRATEAERGRRPGGAPRSLSASLELFPRMLAIRGAKSRAEVAAARDAVEAALAAHAETVFPLLPRRARGPARAALASAALGLARLVACAAEAHERGEISAATLGALERAAAARLNACRAAA